MRLLPHATTNEKKEKPIPAKERDIHKAFVQWCKIKNILVIHIPNEGIRDYRFDNSMGICKGFPDFFIPEVKLPYGGLFLELKSNEKSAISPEQWAWIQILNSKGYLASIVIGLDEAICATEGYKSISFGTARWDKYLSKLRRTNER